MLSSLQYIIQTQHSPLLAYRASKSPSKPLHPHRLEAKLPVLFLDSPVDITLCSFGSHSVTLIVKLLALADTDLDFYP